jgi:hypothetical protein
VTGKGRRRAQFSGFLKALESEADADAGAEEFVPAETGYARANVDQRGFEGGEGFGEVHLGEGVRVGVHLAVEGVVFTAPAPAVRRAEALAGGGNAAALAAVVQGVLALRDHGSLLQKKRDRLRNPFLSLFLFYWISG